MAVVTMPKTKSHYQMVVDGKFVDSVSGKSFETYNPAKGEVLATVAEADSEDVDRAVKAARRALEEGPWGRMSPRERGQCLRKLAQLIADNGKELASVETLNNGKAINETVAESAQWVNIVDFYAGAATTATRGHTIPVRDNVFVYTLREPVGVCGQIVPWNSPLLLALWKVAPALAAGCTVILKPSSFTPLTALELGRLCLEAGIPAGVVNVITGPGEKTGMALVEHPGVDKIAFTGETATGRTIAEAAGRTTKRLSLELGGKSANIVFDDAEFDIAINTSLYGIFVAAGQSCIAGSRLLVHKNVHDNFLDAYTDKAKRIRVGDPLNTETQMGSQSSFRQLEKIKLYVQRGLEEGARLACGGQPPADPALAKGAFFTPTVFDGVRNTMRIAQEEIFGPVLSVIPFSDEEDAIRQANDTIYGLGAGIWTKDVKKAHRVAKRLRAGTVWVNTYRIYDALVPFGGYKASGYGRELGIEALDLYTQTKAVWVDLSDVGVNWFKL